MNLEFKFKHNGEEYLAVLDQKDSYVEVFKNGVFVTCIDPSEVQGIKFWETEKDTLTLSLLKRLYNET